MKSTSTIESINSRYSELAEDCCSLSCGGSLDLAEVQIGEISIDLGSGRGNDVLRMAQMSGVNGHAYGIDVSDGMIRKARKQADKLSITNAQFLQSELDSINLSDETAHVIISNCTLNHAENKQKVWNEIHRLLKKGGRFVISDIYASKEVPERYRNDPEAVAECWAGADTREIYLQTVRKAGFKEVEILEESSPYPKGDIEVSSWTIKGVKE